MSKNNKFIPKKMGSGAMSKNAMYNMIAKEGETLIYKLFRLTDHPNANIALGALNKLIDKVLPNLKATQLSGEEGTKLIVNLIDGGYVSKPVKLEEQEQDAHKAQKLNNLTNVEN